MNLQRFEKVRDGKYLKNYELTYLNKAGKEKTYEMVSRKELENIDDIGKKVSGVSIVALKDGKLLLLREFRMGINRIIYNLCAGMSEAEETIEQCVERELYEETGLKIDEMIEILPPSYSAVAISDIKTHIAILKATGDFEDHSSDNEEISAAFYSKEDVKTLLKTEEFSSRAQIIAYFFAMGVFDAI